MRDTAIRNTHATVCTINGETEAWDKDGEVVVFHDEEVSRTTNGKGLIHQFTLEEVKEFVSKREEKSLERDQQTEKALEERKKKRKI